MLKRVFSYVKDSNDKVFLYDEELSFGEFDYNRIMRINYIHQWCKYLFYPNLHCTTSSKQWSQNSLVVTKLLFGPKICLKILSPVSTCHQANAVIDFSSLQ